MARVVQAPTGSPSRTPHLAGAHDSSRPLNPDPSLTDGELVTRQLTYARALVDCSRELAAASGPEEANRWALTRALEVLRIAADAERAFIFRNFDDPRIGPASVGVAESAAPHLLGHLPPRAFPIVDEPYSERFSLERMISWSSVPERNQQELASGRAVGGPVAELFGETPDFLAWLVDEPVPVRSVQFFPIFSEGTWWGYVGFDDCKGPRAWQEGEIAMLRAAAEIISGALQRWAVEAMRSAGERYERALSKFSQVLLTNARDRDQAREVCNRALEHLLAGTQAGRAYVARNFDDPELGFCNGIYAEACGPGVAPCITNPFNQRVPWSDLPPQWRSALEAGRPHGGPVREMFGDTPFWRDAFLAQTPPLLSVLTVPIHVSGALWGFVGFDQTEVAYRWTQSEIMLLVTAAEMLGSTLRRWQAEAELVRAHEDLEARVEARTAELARRLSVESTLARIAARLMAADDAPGAIRQSLAEIGAVTQARRVVLLHPLARAAPDSGPDSFFDWCSSGVPLAVEQVAPVLRDSNWLAAEVAKRRNPQRAWSTDNALPPEAAAVKAALGVDEATSLVLIPLLGHDLQPGALLCANSHRDPAELARDIESLEVVAGLLAGLLAREAYLRTLEEQVAARTRELSAFLDIGLLVSEERQLTESLELGLLRISEAIGCDATCIHTLGLSTPDGSAAELKLIAARRLSERYTAELDLLSAAELPTRWLAEGRPPLLFSAGLSDSISGALPARMRLPGYARVVIAQLRAGGEVVGILTCYFREKVELTINSISLASAFGEQLGVIISNYHLQQQAKRLAVLDERQRLARELHDAVTQSLYSQTLFTRSAIDALEDGRVDKTVEHLHQLEVTASQALREMRVLLHQLRPSDLAGMGLADAVEARLALVERRIGIKAYSNIDDVSDLGETTEDDLYRVILEGLNNALRHAEATEVDVRLERDGERLSLFIIDNGRGFDPDDTGLGMGLNSIRERAGQLHGELQIDSKPGRGTALLITIPLAPREPPRWDGVAGGRAE